MTLKQLVAAATVAPGLHAAPALAQDCSPASPAGSRTRPTGPDEAMMPEAETPADALQALPPAYVDWRRSTLGRITDAFKERLLLDRPGPARGLRIPDVGCGDGVLATRLAQGGARVSGVDASADMIAAAPSRAKAAWVEVDVVEEDAGNLTGFRRRAYSSSARGTCGSSSASRSASTPCCPTTGKRATAPPSS